MMLQSGAIPVFCCYARKDAGLLSELQTHLSSLQRRNVIHVWYDGEIKAGMEWAKEIKQHLSEAKIVLLLISADFIYSDYCYGTEMHDALERHIRGEARVIPIILRSADWEKLPPGDIQLGQLQALPKDAMPVTSCPNRDEVWREVAEGIERVANELSLAEVVALPETRLPRQSKRGISRRAILIGVGSLVLAAGACGAVYMKLIGGGVPQRANEPTPRPAPSVGTRLHFFEATGAIRALAWSRDGRFIAAANDIGTVPVWDVNDNKLIHTCLGHSDHVEGVSWSPNGRYIVSGSADGTARIWNVETWVTDSVYREHKEVDAGAHHPWVNRVQWSPDGTRIVSCDQTSSDNIATVKIWDANTAQTLVTYSEHRSGVYSVAWSSNNQYIASAGYDGTLRIWQAVSGKTLAAIPGSSSRWLFGVAWSPDSEQVAFGGTDYTLWVTSRDGQKVSGLYTLPGNGGWGIRDIAWSPKGKYIAMGTYFQGVHIIRSDTKDLVFAQPLLGVYYFLTFF